MTTGYFAQKSLEQCRDSKSTWIRLGCDDIARLPATGEIKPYEVLKLDQEKYEFFRHPELLLNRYWVEWLNKKKYYEKYGAPKYEDRTSKDISAESFFDFVVSEMRNIVRQRKK